jgi:predicted N-acetyltransferase YhbS
MSRPNFPLENFSIRPIQERDRNELEELREAAWTHPELTPEQNQARIELRNTPVEGGVELVAVANGRLIGTTNHYFETVSLENRADVALGRDILSRQNPSLRKLGGEAIHLGHIDELSVHPEARHQGVGKQLVMATLKAMKQHEAALFTFHLTQERLERFSPDQYPPLARIKEDVPSNFTTSDPRFKRTRFIGDINTSIDTLAALL